MLWSSPSARPRSLPMTVIERSKQSRAWHGQLLVACARCCALCGVAAVNCGQTVMACGRAWWWHRLHGAGEAQGDEEGAQVLAALRLGPHCPSKATRGWSWCELGAGIRLWLAPPLHRPAPACSQHSSSCVKVRTLCMRPRDSPPPATPALVLICASLCAPSCAGLLVRPSACTPRLSSPPPSPFNRSGAQLRQGGSHS